MSGFAQDVDDMLIARARRGDRAAHAELYARFKRPCFSLAMRMLGNAQAAEDIVHDVFVKMIEGMRGFRGDSPFWGWLRRLTVNAVIDRVRSLRTRSEDSLGEMEPVGSDGGETGAARHDAMRLLASLPARARAVLVLHTVEGYTHREIAELFGQSESYSKSILSRTLQRLHGEQETVAPGEIPCPIL